MSFEIKVPPLGESIVEATVSKWLKQAGDAVTAGEAVVELETDKVNLEVPAEQSGTLAAIVKGEGETVKIGDVLATVADRRPEPKAGSSKAAASNDTGAAEGQDTTAAAGSWAAPPTAAPAPAPATATNGQRAASEVPATPVAMQIAAQQGIDLRDIQGTGPGGRVTKEDVLRASSGRPETADPRPEPAAAVAVAPAPVAPAPVPAAPAPVAPAAAPAQSSIVNRQSSMNETRQRMSRRRQTIAKRLVEAQRTAAMLTTFNEVDMSAVMALRAKRKDSFKERHGVGLGFMSFFSKAVIGALKAFPLLNAEIQGDELVVKHYYDIGVAVGTDEGLVVPVVRDADRKSFAQIEREIGELAGKARAGTLSLAELQGGTFTITNGGIYGSLMSTPILNAPQVGILGMHKIEERPIVVKGEIVVRPMMYLALSYDHRIVDGSEAVRFLVRIKELLEDPEALLLEG